jgi:hypothetical protein
MLYHRHMKEMEDDVTDYLLKVSSTGSYTTADLQEDAAPRMMAKRKGFRRKKLRSRIRTMPKGIRGENLTNERTSRKSVSLIELPFPSFRKEDGVLGASAEAYKTRAKMDCDRERRKEKVPKDNPEAEKRPKTTSRRVSIIPKRNGGATSFLLDLNDLSSSSSSTFSDLAGSDDFVDPCWLCDSQE